MEFASQETVRIVLQVPRGQPQFWPFQTVNCCTVFNMLSLFQKKD